MRYLGVVLTSLSCLLCFKGTVHAQGIFNPDVQGTGATMTDYMIVVTGGGQPGGPQYTYRMGKFEITNQQFCDFLNDAERDAQHAPRTRRSTNMFFGPRGSVYVDSSMSTNEPIFLSNNDVFTSDIRYDASMPLGRRYSVIADGFGSKTKHPVRHISWMGAMKFCNWLTIDQGLGEEHCCYTEGPHIGHWHPVTISTIDWWGKEPLHDDPYTAGRNPNAAERTELVRRYRGYRLFMDDTGLLAPISRPDAKDFNEWLKAAAWDPNAPDTFRTNAGGWQAAPRHWMYGFGREMNTGADANFYNSGDPWDNGPVPVDFYDGTDHGGMFATNATNNRYGFYGMAGNVWEFSQDYGPGPRHCAVYGGSWVSNSDKQAASSVYVNALITWADITFGMRVLQVGSPLEVKVIAGEPAAHDEFGRTVALSGDYAIVGAHFDDDHGTNSGSADVFHREGLKWVLQANLHAFDAGPDDKFGRCVAISGDYAIVGAPDNDHAGADSGAAYVFKRTDSNWTEHIKLIAADAAAGDKFGSSVALASDLALVGAYGDDDNGSASGSAYIFRRDGDTWTQQAKLKPDDSAAGDSFGWAVSLSDNHAIVGAYGDDDMLSGSGSAYVFFYDGANWTQQCKLVASDPQGFSGFGLSVSISNDRAIVGAPWTDDGGIDSGSVYVFERQGTSWSQQGKLAAREAEADAMFGHSVSISGDTIIVGALYDDEGGNDAGAAYVFHWRTPVWVLRTKIIASDAASGDQFGQAVGANGDFVIVGSPYDSDSGTHSGSAYVYETGPASAGLTITVCQDGRGDFSSVQAAIDAAVPGDVIVICDGVYTGPGNRDLDFQGKAIAVRSQNGPAQTIIDCQEAGRAFRFRSGEGSASIVEGITIVNGSVVAASQDGGAILCVGSSPTIRGCVIRNCTAGFGGGIACDAASPTIVDCRFYGNIADYGSGGGISCYNASHAIIDGCDFRGNRAVSGGAIRGYQSNPVITNCNISGNHGNTGGGIYCNRSEAVISGCSLVGNHSYFGGGMYCYYNSPVIANCIISGNASVTSGGGFYCSTNAPVMTNCLVSGNYAPANGGGIQGYLANPVFTNCTVSANMAGGDGGAMACNQSNFATANCVLWGNTATRGPEIAVFASGSLTVSYSDIHNGQAAAYVESGSTLSWQSGNIDADPLFAGGPSGTWTAPGVYDPNTHEITFTDANATWTPNQWVGQLINPDTSQPLLTMIVANTANTVTVLAEWNTIELGTSPITGTENYRIYDLHPQGGSPLINGGDTFALPFDETDLDRDGDTGEPVPIDLDGRSRTQGCVVDMGAYEFQVPAELPGDLDNDCDVDQDDVATLLGCLTGNGIPQYNPACSDAKLDADLDVDQTDFGLLQRCLSGADKLPDPHCVN
ncbi:MAG: SUMF1/EgtB/PvdO family nonheme iron enzyme [Phycisphaerae bacterium]